MELLLCDVDGVLTDASVFIGGDQEIKRFVMDNYERARTVLGAHKEVLIKIADELLAREVLDADQVRRLAAGLPLDDPQPAAARAPSAEDDARPRQKERSPIVPALNQPIPQE